MTDSELLAAWLCAECYGKFFIQGMKHGLTSEVTASVNKTARLSVSVGGRTVNIVDRSYQKSSHYLHEFFDPHGFAPNGPVDTQYVSYFGDIANGCWGEVVPGSDSGSYSVSSSFENSVIYFADLREDIIVYYNERGSQAGSTSGDEAIGQVLAYAEFEGTPGCKGVNALDAIAMPLTLSSSSTTQEAIEPDGLAVYTSPGASTNDIVVAASDRSGMCGGVSYGCYVWGDYGVIDETKPHDCMTGAFTEKIKPDQLELYFNDWDNFGAYRAMDDYDAMTFNSSLNEIGSLHLADGTHYYPSFVTIDPMPRGSWAVDAAGKKFYSMIAGDMTIFNRLDGADPATIAALTDAGVVFYPVAPA